MDKLKIKNNLNLRFKLLGNKNLSKDINTINKDYSKIYENKNLNKSKSLNELSILNHYQKGSISQRTKNKKNDILLLEKIKNTPHHPIFLSFMMNKKNFVNSLEKKFQIRNYQNINKMNNSSIKSNSTRSIFNPIKFEPFNNKKFNSSDNKKNENLKLNNNIYEINNNKEKFKLDLSKIKEITKSSLNINKLKNENLFNNKKRYSNENEKQTQNNVLLNNLGTLNSNITFNTTDNGNCTIIPNNNIKKNQQQILSSIHLPLQNTTNISTINNNTKEAKPIIKNDSLNINEFVTKDIKDKNIKKKLLLSMKDKNQNIYLLDSNRKSFKLRDIHNFPTIVLDIEKDKNKKNNVTIKGNSNIYSKKSNLSYNNQNKNLNSDRLIMSYIFKNRNSNIDFEKPNINSFNIKNELNLQENSKIDIIDKAINNDINVDINKEKKIKINKINKDKNKPKKEKIIITKKRQKLKDKKIKKIVIKKSSKNLIKDNNKYSYIFNIKKFEQINTNNKFLNFLNSDIIGQKENLNDKINTNKIQIILKRTKEIKNIISKEENNLKIYINNINGTIYHLKKGIFENEKNYKTDEKNDKLKSEILFYKLKSIYILQFKKFSLANIFSNYICKFINFSSIYLPLVKIKNSHKRQALVADNNIFSNNLSNSLYPEIKSKFLKDSDPDKLKNFLSNINLIIRLINLDINEPKDDINIKDIINKINKTVKANEIKNILIDNNNNKSNIVWKRKGTNSIDISYLPQFTNTHSRNSTYKKLIKRRGSVSFNNNYFKKNYFPHSVLDKKQFFEVPRRSFNIKLKSVISNANLYNKICNKKNDEIKKYDTQIIQDLMNEEKNLEDLINKKCIENLKTAINKCNRLKGKKNLGDNYHILNQIKGKKYMEETLRMLINEGEESLFLDYFAQIYRKIDINCKDVNNNTLLILSVREGLINVVKELLEKNVNINIRNVKGNTALHYALGNKMYYIADLLKKNGADESILNKNGLTPWECVGQSGVG